MNIISKLLSRLTNRYTGDFPPFSIWERYPNWKLALDEEWIPWQEEATLKPVKEDKFITEDTDWSTGTVEYACGSEFRSIHLVTGRLFSECHIFDGPNPWEVFSADDSQTWSIYDDSWMEQRDRGKTFSLSDSSVFPITVRFDLPWEVGSKPPVFEIGDTGALKEIET